MNTILNNSRKPDIIFCKNGKIEISSRIAKELQLEKGDVIDILPQDEEMYLYIKHKAPKVGRYQAQVFTTNKRGKHCRAWSKTITETMITLNGTKQDKLKLCVGEPTKIYHIEKALPIIYKMAL